MANRLESRHHSPSCDRPNMGDLRIVLVGKNVSGNNRVGNLIFDKNLFEKKTFPPDVEVHSGEVKGRNITVINTLHLLKSNLSQPQISQTVSEVSPPEPHVIILVLQHNDFRERTRETLSSVLSCFGQQAMKRTMILTTDDEKRRSKHTSENKYIKKISTECGGGCFQLRQHTQGSQILQKVDEIITHSGFKETQQSSSLDQVDTPNAFSGSANQKLILAVCGCNEEMKASMSKLLLGKNTPISAPVSTSVCVWSEEKLHGRLIGLVELPALNQLSEEEVMRQSLRCVSLCDPGVHVFLLIVPVGPLTDEDKAGIDKILKIFHSCGHFILLFTTVHTDEAFATDFVKSRPDSQRLISLCGGQFRVMGLKEPENSTQIPELLDYIENMKTEPYSLQMYVKTQEIRVRQELEEQHKKELREMENKIKELEQKIQSDGAEDESDDLERLRIVLIGRTGNGKSATGNTILGRKEFCSVLSLDSVTNVCMKGVGEVEGLSVAVVDTPGLFDMSLNNEQVVEEIVKCVSLSSPGPHVFVIVLSLGRITKEETDTIDLIKKIFGPKAAQFSIVLFTRGDDLEDESIQDYVTRSNNAELKKLIRDCGNRFLVFNNREERDKSQVIQLLKMIEEVKNMNQERYFTNSMFEEAEMSIKKRMEEILKEKEREIQTQNEKLRVKYETEMEELKKTLEDEKRKADEERKKRENEFRQKEEKLIKDFEEKNKIEQKKQEMENQKRLEEEKQKKTEYHQNIEEMKREMENQRTQYEKQQKEREEDRKREEKYRQDQEKMKNDQESIIVELCMKQEEEIKKRECEERKKIEQEEEERLEWKRQIKKAENDRKEFQEEIKRQQREWEDEKKRKMREQEEEERKRKERHEEQLKEKQEELEKMRKKMETEREEERQKIEKERRQQRREREEKEREYEEKKTEMKLNYDQLEQERKEEWERRKRADDVRREEERKGWKEMIDDLKREQEEEIKRREKEGNERKEREEKERKEMKQKHDEEIKAMKKKHEDEARKQAEESNDFRERKEQHVQELQQRLEERQKQQQLLEEFFKQLQQQKEKEIKELLKEVERQKEGCLIM